MVETGGRITLWGVEVFVAIADERSISMAARRLGVSATRTALSVRSASGMAASGRGRSSSAACSHKSIENR